jgi:two-component system sensor histidine kinase BaeS
MKITLHYKLFGAILAAVLAIVVYMSLVMQWSFDRGFLNYVNTVEQEQLQRIATALESYYAEHESWDEFSTHPSRLAIIIATSFPEGRLRDRILEKLKQEKNELFPAPSGPLPDNIPPHFPPRVFLLDRDRNTIFGFDPQTNENNLIHLSHHNSVVGYLGLHPAKDISESHQVVFARQQKLTILLTAIAGFLIAAGLSLPIALLVTRPIRRFAAATRALASGRYHTRIDISASDEFGRLSQDFNNLAAILEKNQQARSQWVADISHELRTPLSVLRGQIEALQDGVYAPTRETFSSLHREVMHLGLLVEDLYQLSLSDIGAISYHRAEVRPCWALEQAVHTLQPQLADKKMMLEVDLDVDSDVSIFADNERLKQLFTNLLANSIRYTRNGGRIEMHVRRDGGNMVYDIQDSHPAVADEHLSRLFERLYRVDSSRSRNLGGAGLGLSICYNIVKGHNGTIEARHSPLGGLWIRVTLPVSE